MFKRLVLHSTTVLLALLCVVLFGQKSYRDLPREAAPDVPVPVVLVSTLYTGVSPSDIETLITIPLETELSGLRDVKKMSSASAEGFSMVTLEFEPEVIIDEALQKVRDRVNRARPKLPNDAELPDVKEISFSDVPVAIVTIAGAVDEQILKEIGEDLAEKASRIPGALEAKVSGGRERQLQVQVDPARLAHYGLSLGDVQSAISNENSNIPGGEIAVGDSSVLIRVPGEFQ